jgi:hypothetical protein
MACTAEQIIGLVLEAFGPNTYPGDAFLQGSHDGCEPYEEISTFFGRTDWRRLDPAFLDAHYSALSFFSEAGFRFFLPAYLIADLRSELQTADPSFHLCHGFASVSSIVTLPPETFVRDSGGAGLLNPSRYGAITWGDHARYRLSVFPREEAQAIAGYLRSKRDRHSSALDKSRFDAALQYYWLDRAQNAPTREALQAHLEQERRFVAALQRKHGEHS